MLIKSISITLIVLATIIDFHVLNAQQFIGISGGYGKGTFLNFSKKQDYDAKYHWKNGTAISSFYETKVDSATNFRIELLYKFQAADMEINNNAGHASFYQNLNYSFQQLNINLIYSFRLLEKKSIKMSSPLGLSMAYTINTKAEGNGWNYVYETQTDSLGNLIPVLTISKWEKNENKSIDLSKFNFGFDVGLDVIIPINNKLDCFIQNRYNIFFTNVTTIKKLRYTSLLIGYLNLGLRYNLQK